MSERESMPYDVVIVGAGPAGLSAAIRLKQLAAEKGAEISVCVLEKGSEVGAHILSGAVVDPRSLDELIPDWRDKGCPMAETPVTDNQHWVLTKKRRFKLPEFISPGFMTEPLEIAIKGRNDLEAPARAIAPNIGALIDLLAAQPGVTLARMSGSGATCFALFENEETRSAARRAIAAAQPGWWCLESTLA